MSSADDLERRIEKLHVATRAETDEHILDDAFAALEGSTREKAAMGGQSVFLRTIRKRTKELVAITVLALVVFALFFSSPSAKAVTLAQIYQAVEKVKNVCISSFRAGQQEPYQQIWISRLMRVRLSETKRNTMLWDLQNWTKKEIDQSINLFSETPIQPDTRQKLEDSLMSSFGFLPFSDIKVIKKDAEWNRVEDNDITVTIPGTEVYDLNWSKVITGNITEYYKWRVFVDTTTDLPKRTEWYQTVGYQSECTLQTIDVITYPADDEIKVRIRDLFGKIERQTAESEDFNVPGTTQINIGAEQ